MLTIDLDKIKIKVIECDIEAINFVIFTPNFDGIEWILFFLSKSISNIA